MPEKTLSTKLSDGTEIQFQETEFRAMILGAMEADAAAAQKVQEAQIEAFRKEIHDLKGKILTGRVPPAGDGDPSKPVTATAGEICRAMFRSQRHGEPMPANVRAAMQQAAAKDPMSVGDDQSIGNLVPVEAYDEVMALSLPSEIVYPLATKRPITIGNEKTIPFLSPTINPTTGVYGDVVFGSIDEGIAFPKSSVGTDKCKLVLHKIGTLMKLTDEAFEDVPANVWKDILNKVKSVMPFGRDYLHLRGNGIKKPLGILNAPCLKTVARTTASQIVWKDILHLRDAHFAFNAATSAFVFNTKAYSHIRGLNNNDGHSVYVADATQPFAGILDGVRCFFTTLLPAVGTEGDGGLFDFSAYVCAQKGGDLRIQVLDQLYAETGEVGLKMYTRFDGQPWLKSVITDANSETYSPFVVLTNAA